MLSGTNIETRLPPGPVPRYVLAQVLNGEEAERGAGNPTCERCREAVMSRRGKRGSEDVVVLFATAADSRYQRRGKERKQARRVDLLLALPHPRDAPAFSSSPIPPQNDET